MKRQTALALAAVFSLSVAGTALAATANPFVDVPAKHWAYDSVNQLAQAGVISGYPDGTFKGDRTMTRYEMATVVAKVMANSDKLSAENKKALEALKAEFSTELNNLGVRVDNLEKNSSKIKFTGEVRERYDYQDKMDNGEVEYPSALQEYGEKSGNKLQTRLRLNMEAKVANDVTFHGRYQSESGWGSSGDAKLTQVYMSGKVADLDYSFGRQPIFAGQGLIADLSGNCDGLVLSGGKDVKVAVGAFKTKASSYILDYMFQGAPGLDSSFDRNFYVANVDAKITDNLSLSASYLKDKKQDIDLSSILGSIHVISAASAYKSTSVGLKYTGIKDFTISGEYGQNKSDATKLLYGDTAKAWMGKIKYSGAEGDKVGSLGIWAGYRNADFCFDPAGLTTLDSGVLDGMIGIADNVKGAEFGVEYTVFKNGILTVQYNDLEAKENVYDAIGTKDKKNFFAQLVYSF